MTDADEIEVIEPDAPAEVAEEEVAVDVAEGSGDAPADEPEEVVITLGEEPAVDEDDPAKAPAWVRDLRKANREKDRRIRDLEQRLTVVQPVQAAVAVGERPKLADDDIAYDEDKFATQLDAWMARKQRADDQQRKTNSEMQAQQASWQQRIDHYNKSKSALKVRDYEDAEAAVDDAFSVVQNGVLLAAFDNSAALKYAIGKSPVVLKELAAITDPIKFAVRLSKIEDKVKITPRKNAPIPERVVRGSGSLANATDNTLTRLQAEADKSGDRSKVAQYMRDKRKAA